jgi:hypothetical protein
LRFDKTTSLAQVDFCTGEAGVKMGMESSGVLGDIRPVKRARRTVD